MEATLVQTFGDNAEARVSFFQQWLSETFGEKADAKQSTLSTPDFMLGGQKPIDVVRRSDTGLQTVMHMLTPVSGC